MGNFYGLAQHKIQGVLGILVVGVLGEGFLKIGDGFAAIALAVIAPAAPQQGLFGGGRALQGISGDCHQVTDPPGVKISKKWAELVAQHALGQANLARLVISQGCFGVALEIDQVGAQVEPGKGIAGLD